MGGEGHAFQSDQGLSAALALPCPALLQTPRLSCTQDFNPVGAIMVPRVPGSPNLAFPGPRVSEPGRDGERKASRGPLRRQCVGT